MPGYRTILNIKLLFLFLLLPHLCLRAQKGISIATSEIKVEPITLKDGLSQSYVSNIIQDKNGYMWFATKDGLNKFDGYRFTVYRHNDKDSNSLAENHINSLQTDQFGLIWIQYVGGQNDVFNPETEKAIHLTTLLSRMKVDNPVKFFFCLGKINYCTDLKSIYKIEIRANPTKNGFGYSFGLKDYSAFLPMFDGIRQFKQIRMTSKGNLYLGFKDSIVCYANPDISVKQTTSRLPYSKFAHQTVVNDFLSNGIDSYFPISEIEDTLHHRFLIKGLSSFTLYNTITERKTDSLNCSGLSTNFLLTYAAFDKQGRLWFADFYNGMFVYDPLKKNITHVTFKLPTTNNYNEAKIASLFIDNGNVLWMGIEGFGLLKYNINQERFMHIVSPLPDYKSLNGIWEDTAQNKIWMMSNTIRIACYNRNTSILTDSAMGANNHGKDRAKIFIRNLLLSDGFGVSENGYWLFQNQFVGKQLHGCHIYLVNKHFQEVKKIEISNQNWFDTKTIVDNNGNTWMAGRLGTEYVLHLCTENSDTIVKKYRIPNKPPEYNSLEIPFISCLLLEGTDKLWLGTLEGLLVFDIKKESWQQFKHSDTDSTSIPGNVIFSLCNDPVNRNILWVGTNGNGLVKFDRSSGKCITYNTRNTGLPNDVIYGILTDKSSNLWVSSNSGLSRFNPTTLQVKTFTEADGLQSNEFNRYAYCKLQSGEMVFGGINGINIFNPDEINDNTYRPGITFTDFKIGNKEIGLQSPEKLLSKTIFATSELHLTYDQNYISFSFASSDYAAVEKNQFQYKLESFDKDWQPATTLNQATYTNLDPGTYTFRVRGTNSDGIWSTHEAAIKIYISPPWWGTWWFRSLMVLLFVAALYAFYRYRLNQVMKLISIRNQIAGDLHDEIGSTLSSISISSTLVQQQMGTEGIDTKGLLQQISNNSDEMMEAMNDIVWAINTRNDTVESLCNRMRAFAIEILEPKDCQLHFDAAETLLPHALNMTQRKNIYLIFKEAVNNAAKYAACQNYWVTILQQGRQVTLLLRDDGRGFNVETVLAKIADKNLGGNGLPGIQKRAADLKGKLTIQSAIGEGTAISVTFTL